MMKRFLLAITIMVAVSSTVAVMGEQIRFVRQTSSVSTALQVSKKELTDTALILAIDTPWEEFLMPAPTAIALLGSLTVLSGKVDFSLNERPPLGGFKFIRHSDSFRTSLVQVSNDAWFAFHNAHTNMHTIQLKMQNVPVHVKSAMNILSKAPARLLPNLLKIPLDAIKQAGSQCVDLANETHSKFLNVMHLMGEIMETTTSSRGQYDTQLADARRQLNASAIEKEYIDRLGAKMEEQQQQIKRGIEKAQKAYDSAMEEIPSGWKLIGQKFVEGLADVTTVVVKALATALVVIVNPVGAVNGVIGATGAASHPITHDGDNINDIMALGAAKQLYNLLQGIKQDMIRVFNGNQTGNPSEMFSAYGTCFNALKTQLADYSGSNTAILINGQVQIGLTLASEMGALFGHQTGNPTEPGKKDEMFTRINSLITQVNRFYAQAVASERDMSIGNPPAPTNAGQPRTMTATEQGSDNARYKAQLHLSQLQKQEERQDRSFSDMAKQHEQLKNVMVRMTKLNMETINYQEIISLIKEGIKALSDIREQWSALIRFFSFVSVQAGTVVDCLDVFVKSAQAGSADGLISLKDRNYMLNDLSPKVRVIHEEAYYLFTLSKTYVDISNKYLMDQLAGMAGLTVLEASQRTLAQLELLRKSNLASSAIKELVLQRKHSYHITMRKKIAESEAYLQELGGASQDQIEAVNKGLQEAVKTNDDCGGFCD